MLRTLAASVFLFVLGVGFMQTCEWAMAKCPAHLDLPPEHRDVSPAIRFQHVLANYAGMTAAACVVLALAGLGVAAIGGAWQAAAWACRSLRQGWRHHRRSKAAHRPERDGPEPPCVTPGPDIHREEQSPFIQDAPFFAAGFLCEGCMALGRNACDLLRLAGREVTVQAVLGIVGSLPRDQAEVEADAWQQQACFQTLLRAEERCKGTPAEKRWLELLAYFFEFVPGMEHDDRRMLQEAFAGVLGGIGSAYHQEPTR